MAPKPCGGWWEALPKGVGVPCESNKFMHGAGMVEKINGFVSKRVKGRERSHRGCGNFPARRKRVPDRIKGCNPEKGSA